MMFVIFALFFCCICGFAGALILTAPQRAVMKEIRLNQARCAMLDAVKELDDRIFARNVRPDSLIVQFQRFAWEAKNRDYLFTVKTFVSLIFYDMPRYAAAAELRNRVTREMSSIPRLNHAKNLFLQSYFQFMRVRHPAMSFLLGCKNYWMSWRYDNLPLSRRKELAEKHRTAFAVKAPQGRQSQFPWSWSWGKFPAALAA